MRAAASDCFNGALSLNRTPRADPIFSDFQNRTFEFFDEPGLTYNVLTHSSATVNMRLTYAGERHIRHQPGKGTFADVLACKFDDTHVLVEITEPGHLAGKTPTLMTLLTVRQVSLLVKLCWKTSTPQTCLSISSRLGHIKHTKRKEAVLILSAVV